jgi:tRNA isopentenyl-2-thiomethyl-A-37 hydroxylase MiaE
MILSNVKDPSVRAFWLDEFAKYSDKFATEATAAIQNKVGQFAANPLIRNMVGQPKSSFDFRKIMDERKILIINLSKGRLGEGNANLIGSMLITKIYLAAMSRADASPEVMKTLPPFYLYVDEFQSFANESFADILSEARKYKLALTIAHQYIEQMSEEVRAAVFGNVGTMMCFRVGAYDAEILEKEFSPQFTIEDIVNLGFAQIYLKLMINGQGSAPFSATTLPPLAPLPRSFVPEIITSSREQFARPREEVEEDVRKWHEPTPEQPRDPNAPPETKKYAPGARPPLRTEGSFQGPGDIGSALRAAGVPPRTPSPAPFPRPPEGESRPFVPRAPSPAVQAAPPFSPPPVPRPMMGVPLRPATPQAQPIIPRPPVLPERPPVAAPLSPPSPVLAPSVPPPIHQPFAQAFAQIQPESPPPPPAPPVPMNTARSPQNESAPFPDRRHSGDRRHDQRYEDRRPAPSRTPSSSFDRSPSRSPFSHTRPASLSTLKNGMKKNKGPSEGNLAELKNALQSVLTQPSAQMPSAPPVVPTVRAPQPHVPQPSTPRDSTSRFFPADERESKQEKSPKEVPEDVLRGLLEN